MIVVRDGRVLAKVAMPIAGLLADRPVEIVAEEVATGGGLEGARMLHSCPFMTFSLIAAPVIPEIRITNRGIADVTEFKLIETEIGAVQ